MKNIKLNGKIFEIDDEVSQYIDYLRELTFLQVGSVVLEINSFLRGFVVEIFPDFDSIPNEKFPKGRDFYLEGFGGDVSRHKHTLWVGCILRTGWDEFIYVLEPFMYFYIQSSKQFQGIFNNQMDTFLPFERQIPKEYNFQALQKISTEELRPYEFFNSLEKELSIEDNSLDVESDEDDSEEDISEGGSSSDDDSIM